jgi:excinuclease UvrABC nuclease subunit
MSSEGQEELSWTEWLDFDKPTVENIPEGAGVYKMHASMKILYIGNSTQNIRQALLECLSDPCTNKATRFSYALTDSSDKVREQLVIEFRSKHNGKFPICMDDKNE